MASVVVLPEIDEEKCQGCGECVEGCRNNAVELVDNKAHIVRPEDCDYCAECESLCLYGAISCPFEIVFGEEEP